MKKTKKPNARKKLSEYEEFYVKQNPDNLSNVDLAKKLGCIINLIDGLRPVIVEAPKPEGTQQTAPVFTGLKAGDAIGRKSVGGREGVAIMTPAASELGDNFRQNIKTKSNMDKYIHKIKDK